jgi:phosphopantothenate synthetase
VIEASGRTKTLDRIVVDRTAEIASDAKVIRLLTIRAPVVTFVNNRFAVYAHETIRVLQEVLSRTLQ